MRKNQRKSTKYAKIQKQDQPDYGNDDGSKKFISCQSFHFATSPSK